MELKDNPLLKQEDYLSGYKESIENLKNNPEYVIFDKLCYEVFNTEMGKALLALIESRYLIPSLVNVQSPTYAIQVIWADGFKDFPRMLINCIKGHEQRIKAEPIK